MNLHDDPEAFTEFSQATAEAFGLPEVYVEKDYWVTYALQNLAESGLVDQVVFKGGTSLSKAFRLIDRFSEDIDLAVLKAPVSDAACKALLKKVEAQVSRGFIPLKNDIRISKGSKFRKTVYQYPRQISDQEFGQASPELLIEVNAFTHPEPFERKTIRSFIAETLIENRSCGSGYPLRIGGIFR
ncbi:MAG: nucleotidyl transferase AbiEii/AbiGii toxin family protein [Acidobacteria bacterium]|nr:nucleotidyl transferase AbiEii/AbiGii toxin family protein [Acidobacteriota bacterium]